MKQVEIYITVKAPDRYINKRFPSDKMLYVMMENLKDIMLDRIARGETPEGGSFKPYNPKYAEWKMRKKGGGGSMDWLVLSGDMLGDLQIIRCNKQFVELGCPIYAERAEKTDKVRPWLSVSDKEVELAFEDALESFADELFDKESLKI